MSTNIKFKILCLSRSYVSIVTQFGELDSVVAKVILSMSVLSSLSSAVTNLPFHSGPASARCEGETARSKARRLRVAGYSRNSLPPARLYLSIDVLLVCWAHADRPHPSVLLVFAANYTYRTIIFFIFIYIYLYAKKRIINKIQLQLERP